MPTMQSEVGRMSSIYAEIVTALVDFVGVYWIIQKLWEESEKAEFGKYVVSQADTFACFIITFVIVALLFIWRETSR